MYRSINTLPVYNFYKMVEDSNLMYLYKGYDDEDENPEVKDRVSKEKESEIFDKIFYDYCDITSDHNLRISTRKQFMIEEWSITYGFVADIIARYKLFGNKDVLSLLEVLDPIYKIDFEADLDKQIKSLERKMIGLKNKIMIYKSKFVNSNKKKESDDNDEAFDLETEALQIEIGLELKRSIPIRTTSVSYYFKLKKMLLKKQESYGKSTNSRSR